MEGDDGVCNKEETIDEDWLLIDALRGRLLEPYSDQVQISKEYGCGLDLVNRNGRDCGYK